MSEVGTPVALVAAESDGGDPKIGRSLVRGCYCCFALQPMQTRVHGIALRRAGAIGSPQSRQTPYIP